ncbi:MAG: FAD-dependent oxidoreductase [Chlamydiia bacterium]
MSLSRSIAHVACGLSVILTCSLHGIQPALPFSGTDVWVPTPDLSDEAIIGYAVGIRPFRVSGLRLEEERVGSKRVLHNYGHGGSGLCLSWGSAEEVVQLVKGHRDRDQQASIAILGGGVMGLTTAYELLREGYPVCIYADSWIPDVTSSVAAGYWSPCKIPEQASDAQRQRIERIIDRSHARLHSDATAAHPEFLGICYRDTYTYVKHEANSGVWNRLWAPHHEISIPARLHFDDDRQREALRRHALFIDGAIFLSDLFKKVRDQGAVLVTRHFDSSEELATLEEPIIVNCTGLGSKILFQDQDLQGIRGHQIHFKKPVGFEMALSTKNLDCDGYFTFFCPWQDRLIVGGSLEDGEEDAILDPRVIARILEDARQSLAH